MCHLCLYSCGFPQYDLCFGYCSMFLLGNDAHIMEVVMADKAGLSAQERAGLVEAVDMKLASLARAKNGKAASPAFVAVYDTEIARFTALKLRLQEL